jgi:hypothetical protein
MDNYTRIFNKSFDDLSFIQNIKNTNDKFVFVFDFDLTLTSKSSDGIIKNVFNYIELFESESKLEKLKFYFEKINKSGNIIYINTRALVSNVIHILKNVNIEIGKDKLIRDIKGSNKVEQINIPFNKDELEMYNLKTISDNKILWGVKKVIYLNQIKEDENVLISNIFFFDDCIININTAKINGYTNCFLIGSNDSGLSGLDFLLIKLSQILDILHI